MKYLYSLLLIILFLSFSCNRTKTVQEVSENTDSLKINSDRIVSTIGETLIPKAKKAVSEWKEYRDVDEFMIKYYNISNTEALDYAEELSELVQLMKDSIRVEELKELNIIARFNVLHNELLRLADMATIPSISNEEVEEEVLKIVEVYSAVNSKINTIYKAEEFKSSLEVDTETPTEIIEKSEKFEVQESGRLIRPAREKSKGTLITPKKTKEIKKSLEVDTVTPNEIKKPDRLVKPVREKIKGTLISPKKTEE